MRILAVDHGEKRIGLAITDQTATIASPMRVIAHVSRRVDAARIAEIAREQAVGRIIVGQSFDERGFLNPAGRRARRFADELIRQTDIPVEMWDESMSTLDARMTRIRLGSSRKRRAGHHDSLAAVVILQSYLENQSLEHGGDVRS